MKWGDIVSRFIIRIGIVVIVICSVLVVVIGNQSMRGAGKALDGWGRSRFAVFWRQRLALAGLSNHPTSD